MKPTLLFASLFVAGALAQATTFTVGTPENGASASSTSPSPAFGIRFSFDSLTPNSTFAPATYASQGVNISSPDGLLVLPYSTQSGPNELFDNSANGSANITIKLTNATNEIGIGIADSDGAPVTIEALTSTGSLLGTAFSFTLPTGGPNPFNGYYVVSDTSADVYGLEIIQSQGNANYSGLAIDDLQVATPEPANVLLAAAGCTALLFGALRKRKTA